MAKIRYEAACPICGEGFLERRRRSFWMRLLPGSKHYLCNCCTARYLTIYGRPLKLSL